MCYFVKFVLGEEVVSSARTSEETLNPILEEFKTEILKFSKLI